MLRPMGFAVIHGVGAAALLACGACGSSELQPIRDPPGIDAGVSLAAEPRDGGVSEAAPADGGLGACKRGVAQNAGPSAAFVASASGPSVSWWYNWGAESPGGDARIEFVPMLWGGGSLNATLAQSARYVL